MERPPTTGKTPRSKPARVEPVKAKPITKKEMVENMLLLKFPGLTAEERVAMRQTMLEDKTSPAAAFLTSAIARLKNSKNYKNQSREERLKLAATTLGNDANINEALRNSQVKSQVQGAQQEQEQERRLDVATQELMQRVGQPEKREEKRIAKYLAERYPPNYVGAGAPETRLEQVSPSDPFPNYVAMEEDVPETRLERTERVLPSGPPIVPRGVVPSGPTIIPQPTAYPLERGETRLERTERVIPSGPTIVPGKGKRSALERTREFLSLPQPQPQPAPVELYYPTVPPSGGMKRSSEAVEQRGQKAKVPKVPRPTFGKTCTLANLPEPALPKPTAKGVFKIWKDMELNEEMSEQIGLERPSDQGGARKSSKHPENYVGMDAEQMVAPRPARDENLKAMERFEVGLPPAYESLLSAPNYLPPLPDDGFEEEDEVPFQQSSADPRGDPRGYTDIQQTDVLFIAEREYDRARRTFLRTRKQVTPVELLGTIADVMAMDISLVAKILADRTLLGRIRDLGTTEMFANPAPYQEEKVPDAKQFAAKADRMFSFFQGDSDIMDVDETVADVEASIGALATFDQAAAVWSTGAKFHEGVSSLVEGLPEGYSAAKKLGETAFSVLRGLGHGAYHVAGGLAAVAGGNPAGVLEHGIGLGELLSELADTVKDSDESFAVLGKLMSATNNVADLGSELLKLGSDLWNRIIPDRLAEMSSSLRQGFDIAWKMRPGYNPPKMLALTSALYDQDNVRQPDLTFIDQDLASDLHWAGQRLLDSSHDGQTLAMEAVDTFLKVDEVERLPLAEQPIDPSGDLVAYDEVTPSKDADIFTKPIIPSKMLKGGPKAPPKQPLKQPLKQPKSEMVSFKEEWEPKEPKGKGKLGKEDKGKVESWRDEPSTAWDDYYRKMQKTHPPLKEISFGEERFGEEERKVVPSKGEKVPPKKAPPEKKAPPPPPRVHQQPAKVGGGKQVPMLEGQGPHIVRKHGPGFGGAEPRQARHPPRVPHSVPYSDTLRDVKREHEAKEREEKGGPREERWGRVPDVGGPGGPGGMDAEAQPVPIWGQEEDDTLYNENGVQPWLPEQPRANASAFPMRRGDDKATAIASAAMQNWQPDHEHPDDNMWNNPLMMDNAMELAMRFFDPIMPDYPPRHWSDNEAFYTEVAQAMAEGYLRGLQAGHATPQPMNPNFERERAMNQKTVDINEQQGWCDVFPSAATQDVDERSGYVDSRWPY